MHCLASHISEESGLGYTVPLAYTGDDFFSPAPDDKLEAWQNRGIAVLPGPRCSRCARAVERCIWQAGNTGTRFARLDIACGGGLQHLGTYVSAKAETYRNTQHRIERAMAAYSPLA
eukprot:3218606-Karenia_brevis.AAC.1